MIGAARCRTSRCVFVGALCALLVALPACNRNKPTRRARTVEPTVTRDIPAPLRGTIGSIARLGGVNPTRASGIGFVVGLDGTGGLPVQEQIAAHLEREMALMGIGVSGKYKGTAIEGMSPRQLMSDRNTAVVIVEAALPPGVREGDPFDVYVRSLNATSLEGGRLWTTELRPGPPSTFGNRQTRVIGEASGTIFINPFAEPGSEGDGVSRTVGRILEGGIVSQTVYIDVILDNPSHARARQIASAINSAFPRSSGDREPTARGRSEQMVRVKLPYRFEGREYEFVELIRHMTLDQAYPEVYARRYAQTMVNQPEAYATNMSWCLQALGERALPFLRDLYAHEDPLPRLAALRAGAHLGDARTAEHLLDLAQGGPATVRPEATRLLGRVDGGPRIEQQLTELLAEDNLVVRVAAYEALAERAVAAQRRRILAEASRGSPSAQRRLSLAALDSLARLRLPDGTMQFVSRRLVDGKFLLDRAAAGEPLIYVTQQGEPRIVLFGESDAIEGPMLVSAWSDRLLLQRGGTSGPIRVRYHDDRTGRTVRHDVEPSLARLIEFMSHMPTPEDARPGLGLSYSQVVGALYEIQRQAQVAGAFTTERDRLLAELLQSSEKEEITVRPETPDDEQQLVLLEGELDDPTARLVQPGETTPRRRSLLVPLTAPTPEPGAGEDGLPSDAPLGRDE